MKLGAANVSAGRMRAEPATTPPPARLAAAGAGWWVGWPPGRELGPMSSVMLCAGAIALRARHEMPVCRNASGYLATPFLGDSGPQSSVHATPEPRPPIGGVIRTVDVEEGSTGWTFLRVGDDPRGASVNTMTLARN
jgi:hypothetical protein